MISFNKMTAFPPLLGTKVLCSMYTTFVHTGRTHDKSLGWYICKDSVCLREAESLQLETTRVSVFFKLIDKLSTFQHCNK